MNAGRVRRLAAILAADVVGYSRQMGADEAGTMARLRAVRAEVIEPLLAEHRGRLFKAMGDGFLAEFSSAVQAVTCARAIQERMAGRNTSAPEGERCELRIGLHTGDVLVEGDDLFGDGVNVAARLEALADPGGICISARVREDAVGKITLEVEDIGTPELKNIAQPIRVIRVRLGAPERPALALPDKPSIVVLPFQNMSGDPEQEYFADGMVEDITTALSRIQSLSVIARNSAFAFKGKSPDVRQVGRELGVRYVLEGSVRKAGNRVRITGQLVEAAIGAHLWADRFDGDLADVFDLQDRVTASVAGIVEPRLQRAEIERAQRKPTQDLGAYDYFLRGMALYYQGNVESVTKAQPLFAKAFALDPEYGAAYGLAARCIQLRKAWGRLAPSAPELLEGARLARLAASYGRDDAVALADAGGALAYLAMDPEAGMLLIERACALNPNSARVWGHAGNVNAFLGDVAASIENFERAIRLSPVDPGRVIFEYGLAFALFMAGRYDDAVAWAERVLSEQPRHPVALEVCATANALSGRMDEARRAMAALRAVWPDLRLSNRVNSMAPFRRPDDIARIYEGLRAAGLPE